MCVIIDVYVARISNLFQLALCCIIHYLAFFKILLATCLCRVRVSMSVNHPSNWEVNIVLCVWEIYSCDWRNKLVWSAKFS